MTRAEQPAETAWIPPRWDGTTDGYGPLVFIGSQLYRRETFLAMGGVLPDYDPACPQCHGTGKIPLPPFHVTGQPLAHRSELCSCGAPRWGPNGPPVGASHPEPPMVEDVSDSSMPIESCHVDKWQEPPIGS